jgi:hypothetical protein
MSKLGFTALMAVASIGLAACGGREENVAVENVEELNATDDMNMSMDMNSDINMGMDMNATDNAMDSTVESAAENNATTNSY